ncbi:MAG: D-2-hydroxyacid dehydrogenase, partial [Dehalococcoidia bacterium]|nr:D-2-hydroxyacid dehydrogenase [Dehalococcoidia bacterium]
MGFKLLVLNPVEQEGTEYIDTWPDKLKETIPGIEGNLARSVGEAMEVIGEVDAAFGNIVPELFERANNLKWIACPQAGPKVGYYHQALIDSEVVLTNTREIYNDHISAHIMAFVLAFARGLQVYIP